MHLLALVVFMAGGAGPAPAPAGLLPQEGNPGWVLQALPGMELWFHGMALIDSRGPGPVPLYDPGYAEAIGFRKAGAGLAPTPLDAVTGRLRDAFRRDPSFEVMHFVPLYFAQVGRVEMFEALKRLAVQASGVPSAPSSRSAMGLSALAAVLPAREQRSLLGELVAALEAEWEMFYAAYYQGRTEALGQTLASAQALWDQSFGPALNPFLSGEGLSGGVLAFSPALGPEGRVFAGIPADPRDNVLVVREPDEGAPAADALFPVIRELAFPLARKAWERSGMPSAGRFEDEARVTRGAVRAGAMMLELRLPQEANAYKEFFLVQSRGALPEGPVGEAFERAFPVEPAFLAALRDELRDPHNMGG